MEVENVNGNPETIKEPVQQAAPVITPNPLLEKVLQEKKNAMAKIAELENALQSKVDEELKAKEDWKSLSERYEKEKNEWQSKYTEITNTIKDGHKLSALKKELSKIGADDQSMEFLLQASRSLMTEMKFDEEHNVVLGAEDIANKIKAQIPRAFGTTINARADHSAPDASSSSKMTSDQFARLSVNDQKKRMEEIFANKGITVKK